MKLFNIFKSLSLYKSKDKEVIFRVYSSNRTFFVAIGKFLYYRGIKQTSISTTENDFEDDLIDLDNINSSDDIDIFYDGISLSLSSFNEKLFSISFTFENNEAYVSFCLGLVNESKVVYYGYLANSSDIRWQSEESLEIYEVNKRSTKGLSFTKDAWGRKCIDISNNFGKRYLKDSFSFVAAHRLWFGDILKHELKAFEITNYNYTILKNNLNEIVLFEGLVFDYTSVRYTQKQFLKDLRIEV